MGTLVHSLILEPDIFYENYQQEANKSDYKNVLDTVLDLNAYCKRHGLATGGKKSVLIKRVLEHDNTVPIWSLINYNHDNRMVIKKEMWNKCHSMRDSVLNHPQISSLFDNGRPEVSAWGQHAATKLLTKCRCDWLRSDGIVIDLKTSVSSSPDGFSLECAKYNYALQQSHYMNTLSTAGYQQKEFLFVVVEKEPPFLCQCYVLDEHSVRIAEQTYHKTLQHICRCHNDDKWPSYTDDTALSLPIWKLNEMDFRYA